VTASALPGPKGNREVFLYLRRGRPCPAALEGARLEAALAAEIPATTERPPRDPAALRIAAGDSGRRRSTVEPARPG
jgi:hypothetical protein